MELLPIFLATALVYTAYQVYRLYSKNQKSRRALDAAKNVIDQLTSKVRDLKSLEKYQAIKDVDAEVAQRRKGAEITVNNAKLQAEQIKSEAEKEARATKSKSSKDRSLALSKIELLLEDASEQHSKILNQAIQEAEEIAGDAYKALSDADMYEKAAKAMENTLRGYGDEYLVSNHSLLDELAENFGHKEAGQNLKKARAYSKTLLGSELAADCDYVESRRRQYAIHFVLDAFNGKVDSALSKAKHDNFGKLKQEIEDGFNIVNSTGKAFKNARITKTYLDARIDELTWAVRAFELKRQEREEQRQIREAMREEERARREFEKAMKDAEKQEKMLQKAMTVARKHLEHANAEQRQQYEAQLQELEQKLHEAEEKNSRALSMAQQTRLGHVYVISNIGSFGENVFKIGMTRRLEPLDRIKELGDASVPFTFDVHAMINHDDAPSLENELHKRFDLHRVNKVNTRKEFFNIRLSDIKNAIDDMGINVRWTMAAEAFEYHESKALQLQAANRPTTNIDSGTINPSI